MDFRASSLLLPALLIGAECAAAPVATGKHWQIAISQVACENDSLAAITMRVRYLGGKGLVEAPVNQLADGQGKRFRPKSLVWRSGSKLLPQWLPAGGVRPIEEQDLGVIQVKFDVRAASEGLAMEFGDIRAFPIARKSKGRACDSLLKPAEIQGSRARGGKPAVSKSRAVVYRSAYPCLAPKGLRVVNAEHPPLPARQLLIFGRGFLPSAREVELPMGKAPAQPYAYTGVDDSNAVANVARAVLASDFPEYGAGLIADEGAARKFFAFDWGAQTSESGDEVYSIGIYETRACGK